MAQEPATEQGSQAKTRFELVSRGIGKIAGGLVQLVLGVILLFFWRDLGLTLIIVGIVLLALGIWGIVSGAQASQKEVACPHCGETNNLLADVKEFVCYNCQKPLKLIRR